MHSGDESVGVDTVRAGVLHRILNTVDLVGHRAEVALLRGVGVAAQGVQRGTGVLDLGCPVIGGDVVGLGGVAGQEGHQFARVGALGDLVVAHHPGEMNDVLIRHHVVGAGLGALVLGDVEEGVGVVGVVDHHLRGQALWPVLEVVGGAQAAALEVGEGQAAILLGGAGRTLGLPGLIGEVRGLHRQVAGVGVAAEPSDVGELTPERPLAPLAGAVPVADRVAPRPAAQATEAAVLEDQHVIGAVVADHRGHDPVRGQVLDCDMAVTLEAHRLGTDVLPGGGADRGVGFDQVHVLGEPGIQALVHQVADPVDVGVRVVAELCHRVVVVVGTGGDVDEFVAQTGGSGVGVLDQFAPAAAHVGRVTTLCRGTTLVATTTEHVADQCRADRAQQRERERGRVGLVVAAALDQVTPAGTGGDGVQRLVDVVVDHVDAVADHVALGVARDVVASLVRDPVDGLLGDEALGDHGLRHPAGLIPDDLPNPGVVQHQVVGREGMLGEQVAVRFGGAGVLALLEGDRVGRGQALVGVDVVDRLDG